MERLEVIAAIGGDDQRQRYRQAEGIVDVVLAITKEPETTAVMCPTCDGYDYPGHTAVCPHTRDTR